LLLFKLNIRWRNQNVADGTVRTDLYDSALSISNADSTLWIFKEQPCSLEGLRDCRTQDRQHRSALRALKGATRLGVVSCEQESGGGWRDRTDDPLLAKQVLSQLS
jgi:hypothetical protein